MNERAQRDEDLIGTYHTRRASLLRRITMETFDALPGGHNMLALVEFDVSRAVAAVQSLQQRGEQVSMFAFIVHCIAKALKEHRSLNAVRSGSRIVEFDDVDINVPIEVATTEGHFPRQMVLRRADTKTPTALYAEIRTAREQHQAHGVTGSEDAWSLRIGRVLLWLPGFVRRWLLRRLVSNPLRVKARAGTTFVTSVAKFAQGSGFAIPFSVGPNAVTFAIAGTTRKPVVVDEQIVIRDVLSMTIVLNHDLVDGGPAATFASRLKALIEAGDVH